jgi:ornithine cyclodeaminase/alanine dehydrogenase-like protein (mu-crystallin family)
MLYLNEAQVRELLPMRDCIALMRTAFERLASGSAINQPRRRLLLPTRSALHYMAATDGRYFGIKVYSTHPQHGAHFRFLLYRAEDAELLAILEANFLGQIRTGAVSGLATSLLARPGAKIAALIGSGFQARSQLEALVATPSVERVRVWSRSAEKRTAFAQEYSGRFGLPVEAAPSAELAIRGADIVTTATSAKDPVLDAAWVADGAHINAMGSNQAQRRELPAELVMRAGLIVVDSREQSRMESGDLLLAFQEEADWQRTLELQDVVTGRHCRASDSQITLFKSNGLAVEDVIAAGLVYERAIAQPASQ